MSHTVIVHGGLVPGLALEKQDPNSVMNMRSIDLRSHVPSAKHFYECKERDRWGRRYAVPWSKLWTKYQDRVAYDDRISVVYGHDALAGVTVRDWSWGLDGRCARGGTLNALVIGGEGRKHQKGEAGRSLVSVKCKGYK